MAKTTNSACLACVKYSSAMKFNRFLPFPGVSFQWRSLGSHVHNEGLCQWGTNFERESVRTGSKSIVNSQGRSVEDLTNHVVISLVKQNAMPAQSIEKQGEGVERVVFIR